MTAKHNAQSQQQAEAPLDDTTRAEQQSHGSEQNRSKKDGHASQLGSGSDQQSQRQRGQGARRPG